MRAQSLTSWLDRQATTTDFLPTQISHRGSHPAIYPLELMESQIPDLATLRHSKEPSPGSPHVWPVLAYPSYLKKLASPEMSAIWSEAADGLASAREFKAIGYSLPESDSAIRALLIGTKSRISRGDLKATVINPDRDALRRWNDLLGDRVLLECREI